MTKQTIGTGSNPNDGTGDPIRTAFGKVNSNFDELYVRPQYARTQGEIDAGVTPTDYSYPPGNVLRYGADPTGATDSLAAFQAAHDSFEVRDNGYSARRWMGGVIHIPYGDYTLSDTWEITRRVAVMGDGQGEQGGAAGTAITWPANKTGIRVYSSVVGDYPGDPSMSAASAYFSGINMTGTITGSTTGHGIWASTWIYLDRMKIAGFAENGIRIDAYTNGGGDPSPGLANSFAIYNTHVKSTGGTCLFIRGSDANVGTVVGSSFSEGGSGWCVEDYSYYGTTYVGCHFAGSIGSVKSTAPQSIFLGCYVEEASTRHHAMTAGTVIGGILAGIPGGPAITITGDGSGATAACRVAGDAIAEVWITNGGSGYTTATVTVGTNDGGSGANLTATVDAAGHISGITVVDGGSGYSSSYGVQKIASASDGLLFSGGARFSSSAYDKYGEMTLMQRNVLMRLRHPYMGAKFFDYFFRNTTNTYDTRNSDGLVTRIMTTGPAATLMTAGRGSPLPAGCFMYPQGIWLGNRDDARNITSAAAAPTTGTWARGDVVFNRAPSAGGTVGWVCVTGGTPGTWKTFGTIEA